MRATKMSLVLTLLVISLMTVAVSADTGCPAVDASKDKEPTVKEITVYRISGKTVELIGIVEDPDSGLRSWIWDFGDGTVKNMTGGWSRIDESTYKMVVTHTYSDYRTYNVVLKVIDAWLKPSNTMTKLVTITKTNYNPVVSFREVSPNPAQPDENIVFEVEATDPDGSVVEYYWDFGDGKRLDGANLTKVTHSYAKEGNYVVSVKVEDDKGAYSDVAAVEVYVRSTSKPAPRNKPPVIVKVEFSPKKPLVGDMVTFRATASDPDGDKLAFQWNFDDGTISNGGPEITHAYGKEGAYTVKVTAIDSKGASSPQYTVSLAVTGNKPPQATVIEVNTKDNKTFLFQGMGIDPDGQVVAYEWDFGDGAKVSGGLEGNSIPHKPINHAYSLSGNFTVKYRVKDDGGAWSPWVTRRIVALVPKEMSSASWIGSSLNDLGIAAGIGTLIVLIAGYLAYKESMSNAFMEKSKEKMRRSKKVTIRRVVKERKPKKAHYSHIERRRRPWPS